MSDPALSRPTVLLDPTLATRVVERLLQRPAPQTFTTAAEAADWLMPEAVDFERAEAVCILVNDRLVRADVSPAEKAALAKLVADYGGERGLYLSAALTGAAIHGVAMTCLQLALDFDLSDLEGQLNHQPAGTTQIMNVTSHWLAWAILEMLPKRPELQPLQARAQELLAHFEPLA